MTQPRVDPGRLAGKVALVVGGGTVDDEVPGTGAATARVLAAAGAQVAVVGRTAAHTERTCRLIEADGGTATAIVADITEDDACHRAVAEVASAYGRLDVLVNNVGYATRGTVIDTPETTWQDALEVNLLSVVRMSRHAIPDMVRGGGGSIINVSSIAAVRAAGSAPYSASKGALHALTQDMALQHGPDGIRVNLLVPGHLHTPMGTGHAGDEEVRRLKRDGNMLKREGTGWDVALAALFFACEESRFITAVALPIDGGMSATAPLAVVGALTGGAAASAYGERATR